MKKKAFSAKREYTDRSPGNFTAAGNAVFFRLLSGALLAGLLLLLAGCVPPDGPDLPSLPSPPAASAPPSDASTSPSGQDPLEPTPVQDTEIIFKDPYLEDVVRRLIGKSLGSVYVSDVTQITSLTARVKGIRDIEDLRYFTALEELDLYGNQITDLSPLGGLSKLKKLNISRNYTGLFDKFGGTGMSLQGISSLVLLENLEADGNGITDLSPIADLVNLKYLSLSENSITSVEALSKLTQLTTLYMGRNQISDISPLAGLTELKTLSLESNCSSELDANGNEIWKGLSDITAVEGLTSLTWLNISHNIITSIEPASSLFYLEYLNAASNNIADIEYMRGSRVRVLNLEYNRLSRYDAILEMDRLEEIMYQGNPNNDVLALEIFLFMRDHPGQPLPPDLAEELEDRQNAKKEETHI